MSSQDHLFNSSFLSKLATEVGLELFDIGSRGGLLSDFLPVAPYTNAIGFEPDTIECNRLNNAANLKDNSWKTEKHFPVALGEKNDQVTLHLCQQLGCSSTLQPNEPLLKEFGRNQDFQILNDVTMPITSLNEFCREQRIADADFLKVDVQGAELSILKGGSQAVEEWLLGIRVEVEFAPLYLNQPQFSEIEMHLRSFGFYTADWIYQRHWRYHNKAEHSLFFGGLPYYSRGRLIHSDALFLRDHHWVIKHAPEPEKKLVRLALIAILYHHIDLAEIILQSIHSGNLGLMIQQVDLKSEIRTASRTLHRIYLKRRICELFKLMKHRFGSI